MTRCVILSARSYDFEDEKTNKAVQGVTVHYIEGKPENEEKQRGSFPMSISAPLELWPQLQALPGLYECDFKQRPGKNGRPTLQLVGVQFVSAARFVGTEETASAA